MRVLILMIKFIPITIALYFLTLFQTSFLAHFAIFEITPNIVALAIIIWNIFEKRENFGGLYIAAMAGLFLDIFSRGFVGMNIVILIIIASLIKFGLKRYVKIPFSRKS